MNYKEKLLEPQYIDPSIPFIHFKNDWYPIGHLYWSKQESTNDGMLGGFSEIHEQDIKSSKLVLEKCFEKGMKKNRCVDLASGIGRISEHLLSNYFEEIHLVDPIEKFLIEGEKRLKEKIKIKIFINGLENWNPICEYDCFWCQWGLMFLKDDDVIKFLKKCKSKLSLNGFIIIKDNSSTNNIKEKKEFSYFYPDDRSISRVYNHFIDLFQQSNLILIDSFIDQYKLTNSMNELSLIFFYILK